MGFQVVLESTPQMQTNACNLPLLFKGSDNPDQVCDWAIIISYGKKPSYLPSSHCVLCCSSVLLLLSPVLDCLLFSLSEG